LIQENCKNIFTIIKSEQCTLSMNEKIALGKLFYEFLMDKGTSVSLFREVGDDIKKMEKSDKNTPTAQTNERKRQLTETSAYEQQQKRVATSQVVTPTATMTPQAQAYPSTAYYGDMNAASYQYNAQVIILLNFLIIIIIIIIKIIIIIIIKIIIIIIIKIIIIIIIIINI